MMIALLSVLFCISSLTASQGSKIPAQNGEGIGLYNGGLLGAGLGVFLLAREWRHERDIRFKTCISEDGESALLTYYPEQRNIAKKRQHSVLIGGLSLTSGFFYDSPITSHIARIRSAPVTMASVLEQGLVPTVICSTTQEMFSNAFPHFSPEVGDAISVSAAYLVPRGASLLRISPERMLIHSFLVYLSGDLHNQYRNIPFLKLLTVSFQSAARGVPLMQILGGSIDGRSSYATLHAPRYRNGNINLKQEFHHAILPVALHTAVGFTARAFAATPIGKKIEKKIDEQLVPLVGEEQNELLKSIGFECGIGLCTFAVVNGAEKLAKDGCSVM